MDATAALAVRQAAITSSLASPDARSIETFCLDEAAILLGLLDEDNITVTEAISLGEVTKYMDRGMSDRHTMFTLMHTFRLAYLATLAPDEMIEDHAVMCSQLGCFEAGCPSPGSDAQHVDAMGALLAGAAA